MTSDRYIGYAPCPCCDGAGEWDEGPLPASSGATEPDFRQVFCPECDGTGRVECDEARTLDDLIDEVDAAGEDFDMMLDQMAIESAEGRIGEVQINRGAR